MTLRERWNKTSLPNKLLVETGALVAFGTIFYAGAAAVQIYLMKENAKESAAQVERLVGSTNQSIDRAVRASSDGLNQALRQNKEALDVALSQSKASLDASTTQSKAALDASIASSRSDQRPWLTASRFQLPSEPEEGKPIQIQWWIQNTGKTPALDEYSQSWLIPFVGEPPMTKFTDPPDIRKSVVLRHRVGAEVYC